MRIGQVPETRCAKIGHSLSRVRPVASLPMTGGMAHARARTRLTGALVALVAACAPATADAAIPPQQVEALDRQGATEIVIRREPGLTASERADVRADADVDLVAPQHAPGHGARARRAGRAGRGRRRAESRPRRRLRRAGHRPVRPDRGPVLRLPLGPREHRPEDAHPRRWRELLRPGLPRRRHGRPGGVDQGHRRRRVGRDRRHRRADLAPGPRRADHQQPGRDRHRRAQPRQAQQRRRRRRQRLRRRLAGLGLRAREHAARRHRGRRHARPGQPSAGQPRARHARRRHRRGPGRQQRGHRRCRVRRQDHAAARPGRQRARLEPRHRGGVRLRRQDGRADRQRQPRRPRPGPVAARGRPGAPEHAVRGRGRQRQHQRRRDRRTARARWRRRTCCASARPTSTTARRPSPTTAPTTSTSSRPGTAILSTYLSPAYQYLQGTSMASPNTAGVAALVLSGAPRPDRAGHQERDHGLGRRQARARRQGDHRRPRERRPRRLGHARRRARERLGADHHRPDAPGRDAQHLHGPVEPRRLLVRLPVAALARQRRDLDDDPGRDRLPPTSRALRTSTRCCAARSSPPTRSASPAPPRPRSARSRRARPSSTAAP